jgi:hypothetical protein
LLVVALVVILVASAQGKIQQRQTLILSGIAASFFGLWIVAMPVMNKRRIYIVTNTEPKALMTAYSLQPIRYRFGPLADADLANSDFEFPPGRDPIQIRFDLTGLINSYDANLRTVVRVAQVDPQCFSEATQGVSYTQVAAKIKEICPGSLVNTRLTY